LLISKKDLLKETGISYGQLYRWKREGLIPEEWFIKQPSFTGQETFFPKDKILNRIRLIKELKDKYSLEELAKMLSPEISERSFTIADLKQIEEISSDLIPTFVTAFDKNNFTYIELIVMIALSNMKDIPPQEIVRLIKGIQNIISGIKSTNYILSLFQVGQNYYAALNNEQAEFHLDSRLNIVKQIRLNDISNHLRIKYRKSFNFRFDSENESLLLLENGVTE